MQWLETYGWFVGVPLAAIVVALIVFRPGAQRGYQRDGKIPFAGDGKADKDGRS